MNHIPVLLKETLELLSPQSGEFFIDGTLGDGGHTAKILEKIAPNGMFLGLDWDEASITRFRSKTKNSQPKTFLEIANYAVIPEILKKHHLPKADGLLLDLGFSSAQLENSGKGFSFLKNEPLIMTYSPEQKPVSIWLNKLSVQKLENIIRNYGEERFAGRIAKAIKSNLPINTSGKLSEIIVSATPRNYEKGRIHPATRTFQALRIFGNQELENLETLLKSISEIMSAKGRVAIISFHSLEDRLVKNYFRNLTKENKAILLAQKPIVPSFEEIRANSKSRSAKLRAIRVI